MIALNELHRLLRKSRLPDKRAFEVKELFDQTTLTIIRNAHCAAVVDKNRFIIGSQDNGLICVEMDRDQMIPVGGN